MGGKKKNSPRFQGLLELRSGSLNILKGDKPSGHLPPFLVTYQGPRNIQCEVLSLCSMPGAKCQRRRGIAAHAWPTWPVVRDHLCLSALCLLWKLHGWYSGVHRITGLRVCSGRKQGHREVRSICAVTISMGALSLDRLMLSLIKLR